MSFVGTFWRKLIIFMKEIISFGLDAFVLVAAKEVAKRFYARLKEKGALVAGVTSDEERPAQITPGQPSPGQAKLPFLDEYRD